MVYSFVLSSCFMFFSNPIFLTGFDMNQEPVHMFDLNVAAPVESVQRKDASEVVLNQVFQELLRRSKNGVLPRNATSEVAVMYNLGIRTVQRCWAEGKLSLDLGIMVSFASKKRGKCGRKPPPLPPLPPHGTHLLPHETHLLPPHGPHAQQTLLPR
jgi:hypothetical protein